MLLSFIFEDFEIINNKQQLMNSRQEAISSDFMEFSKSELQCFIEPVKPKLYNFDQSDEFQQTMNRVHHVKFYRYKDANWRPILQTKKLNQDPKFIMSLERKKARIISGIRDKQIDGNIKEKGKMKGSKVKYGNKMFYSRDDGNWEKGPFLGKIKQEKQHEKKKKNPHMNFSLRYITEQKKNIEKERMSDAKLSAREKGSKMPYFNIFLTENMLKGKKITRPKTTLTKRDMEAKQKQRPQSVFFL